MKSPQSLKRQAIELLNTNRLAQARDICLEAHQLAPGDGETLHLLSVIHARQSDLESAEQWAMKAAAALPGDQRVRMLLANLSLKLNKPSEAKRYYEAVLSEDPQMAEPHFYLACILTMEGDVAAAEDHFKHAIRLQPGHTDSHVNLGMIYEALNKLPEARNEASAALALNPDHHSALLLLAKLEKREKNYAQAEALLRKILTPGAHPSLVARVGVEHGHVLDKLGEYDKAFDAFLQGKSAWARLAENAPFDRQECQKRIRAYEKWISADSVKPWHPESAQRPEYMPPVFFVGFPRSGTTLMEQILGQQDGIVTTNEKPLVHGVIARIPELLPGCRDFPQCLSDLPEQDIAILRDEYWRQAEKTIGRLPAGTQLVDKNPLNLIDLGFISRVFPDARVLVALRDPRDVCISCFMQGFDLNPAMVNFLDLESTTGFYAQVMSLWLHYRSVLPIRWHEYRYEDLINNFEQTTKGVTDFLGIGWTEKYREYYVSVRDRHISTPSYQDVARPLYDKSMARWKNYERYLSPHMDKLTPFLREFGYR